MSKEAELVVFDIPEDIVVNILCRLPVKSLIRFSCVSKRWRSIIISDKQFARTTFQLASQNKTLRQRLLLLCTNPKGPSRFQCLGDLVCPKSLVQSLTLMPEVETARVMLASCNGLVVIGEILHSFYTNLSLWNPSTGFFRKIPDPKFLLKYGTKNCSVAFAFVHVMAIDDYRLVFFVPLDFTVHVFSTRESSWKVTKAPQMVSTHLLFPSERKGFPLLVSNEACHWVPNWNPPAINAFDLAEEEFRQLSLPLALKSEPAHLIYTQVHSEGSLYVWNWNPYRKGEGDLWEMKEYGVPESWVKLFHLSELDLPADVFSTHGWEPVLVTEDGTVVINIYNYYYKFYVKVNKTVSRFKCHREGLDEYAVMVYDETLLSV